MSLRKKLLILVIVPVIVCTTIAVLSSALKINHQGVDGLEDKSNAILTLNVDYFIERHIDGSTIEEDTEDDIRYGDDSLGTKNYRFRISSANPENPIHQATNKEMEFIDHFVADDHSQITHIDKETNTLWVMRPVYMDESKGCLDCHSLAENESTGSMDDKMDNIKTNSAFRGMFMVISKMEPVQKEVRSAIFQISIFGIIIMVLAIFIGFIVVTRLLKAIRQIINVSQKVSEGDLKQKVKIHTHDELEELGNYINSMVGSLNNVLREVHRSANDLAKANKEIADTTQIIANGTQNQVNQFEILVSSMDNTSENTVKATDFINKSVQNTDLAGKGMSGVMEAMNKIEESSAKINEVVGIISDISFQTNLLALNAAIEAARAGEHGKGFAVVANEVKKLSDKTTTSAKEIEENK